MNFNLGNLMVLVFIGVSISGYSQLKTVHDDLFWDNRESGIAAYDVPEGGDENYPNVVYIDPEASTNGDGTMASPLNSWPSLLKANTAYLQKRGTVSDQNHPNQKANYIIIGAYGEGKRPVMKTFRLDGGYNVVRDVAIPDGGVGFGAWPYNDVEGNWIYNCEMKQMGVFTSETKIIGNIVHGAPTDAIWISGAEYGNYCRNIEIAWNHIYDVNMDWFPGATQSDAPGDAIQAQISGLAHIHHNLIDRSSTGNKFNIILGEPACANFKAIIEDNIFYSPIKTPQGGSILYLKKVVTPAIVRNNKFIDMEGDGLTALVSERYDVQFYGNLLIGLYKDIHPKASIYHNNTVLDMFAITANLSNNCKNNIIGNIETKHYVSGADNLLLDDHNLSDIFYDHTKGNYSLRPGSIAIDAGEYINPEWTTDMLGVPVPQNGLPDMGAFEFTSSPQPAPNRSPVLRVQKSYSVVSGAEVTIDASSSYDPDGDAISFEWSSATLSLRSVNAKTTGFTAPEVSELTLHTVTLKVSDNELTTTTTIDIQVNPKSAANTQETATKLTIKGVVSSGHDGNIPEYTLDQDFQTRWSAQGDGEWIQYELTGVDSVKFIKIAWYNGESRVFTYDVIASMDGYHWTNLVLAAKSSGTSGELEYRNLPDARAKFIRIVGHNNTVNDWNSITEVEIYGVPEKLNSSDFKDELNASVNIYPTVTSERTIFVEVSEMDAVAEYRVFDIQGKLVTNDNFYGQAQIDLMASPAGMYFIQLLIGRNKIETHKVILK